MGKVNKQPIKEPIYADVICCNCDYEWEAILPEGWDGKNLLECPKCKLFWGTFKEGEDYARNA